MDSQCELGQLIGEFTPWMLHIFYIKLALYITTDVLDVGVVKL